LGDGGGNGERRVGGNVIAEEKEDRRPGMEKV
jgi:hypothetical protein